MPFPEVDRVVYSSNPLDQAIAQVRFPPILRIDADTPADFQDWVKDEFPAYSERSELSFQFPADVEGESPPSFAFQFSQASSSKNHEFESDDGSWKINLTRTFMALSTNDYTRWDDFTEKLAIPLNALIGEYGPSSFTRVGIRYINVICKSSFALEDQPWSELIQPRVVGMLAEPDISDSVRRFDSKFEIQLSDGEGLARIRTGFVQNNETEEICFKLDNDLFHGEKMEVDLVSDKLEYLHNRSRRLFRWSITDRLHNAMEPVQV